jgi:hypothetical protein
MTPLFTDELAEMRLAEMQAAAQGARLARSVPPRRGLLSTPYRSVRIGAGRLFVRYGLRLIAGPTPSAGVARPK